MSSIGAGRDAINVSAGHDAFNIGNANNIVINTGDYSHVGAASGSRDVRRDSFQPSFHTPSNPREIVLDFGNSPDHAQPQTQEARVLQEVLRDDCNDCETRVIGIYGKGGVGKSCILRALARHEKVKEKFPDGVYFLSLGMDAAIDTLIDGLVGITLLSGGKELGAELRRVDNLHAILNEVRKWMKGKRCLLLVDDLWERNGLGGGVVRELERMFCPGSGSVVVMTTRFVSIATRGTEIEIEPHETASGRAEAILLRHAKFEPEEIEDEKTREVFVKLLKMCGGLPLFLCVVGRAVAELCIQLNIERRLVWGLYCEMVEDQQEGVLLETGSDEYPDLGKTLLVSLEILCNGRGKRLGSLSMSGYSLFEMHRALCVFKKQASVPMSVCRRLWNVKTDEGAIRIGKGFADVGLGDIEVENVGEGRIVFMRLHDLVQVFAVECAKENNEVSRWHERLLERFSSNSEDGESRIRLWEVEEKSEKEYLLENVCRHLASSGHFYQRELAGLLLSGEWTLYRHVRGGLSAWKRDCSEYLGRRMVAALSQREQEIVNAVRMVRDAVVESWPAVHQNPHELGFQIFGRLVDSENDIVKTYLELIERVQNKPWLKPMQRLWTRPEEGGMIAQFRLEDNIHDIAVQKDPFIAAAAVDEGVVIIDLKEMVVRRYSIGHTGEVGKAAISVDGKRVSSWLNDCTVRHLDVMSGQEDRDKRVQLDDEENNEDDEVTCAAFCSDKSLVVTGSEKGRVKVWDVHSGERIGRTMDASKWVSCIGVSSNGESIAVGVDGGALMLWDVKTFTLRGGELKGHLEQVRSIEFSCDGRYVASVGHPEDGTIRLWDVENKAQIRDPFAHCTDHAYCITFIDNQRIVSGHCHGSITVWDVPSGVAIRSWKAHFGLVEFVLVSCYADRECIISVAMDSTVRMWDLQTAANVRDEFNQHDNDITCLEASPDGRFFVSASRDKTLRTWNAVDGTALKVMCGHEDAVTCVAVSADSRRLVSGSQDCTVRVWDVATGAQVLDAFRGHEEAVNCVAYSADGRFVISGSDDCTAHVWRIISNPEVGESICEPVSNRMRMPDTGVRDMISSRERPGLEMILNHEEPSEKRDQGCEVTSVAMNPDGQRVLSSLRNGEIWVWNTNSGTCIYRTQSPKNQIVGIEISEKNEVVTMSTSYEELRWQLDCEGSLTRVLESEDATGVAHAEPQEGSIRSRLESVICVGPFVLLDGSDKKIATLPDYAVHPAWKYDAQRKVLFVALEDWRVVSFRVEF